MKKHRRILGVMLAMVFSVSLFIGGGAVSVFGENAIAEDTAGSFYVPASVTYLSSETFTLGTGQTLVITAPNGKVATLTETGAFAFSQVGVYTLEYKKADKLLYSKTVYCEIEAEYELRVDYGGADIPTYAAENMEFIVPRAELYFKSEDMDEFEPVDQKADPYTLKVETTKIADGVTVFDDITDKMSTKDKEGKHSYARAGTYVIVYSAKLGSGERYFTKTFEDIFVQGGDFKDEGDPKISVSGVPTTASINTQITLPKASVTDNYDKNAKVFVTVKAAYKTGEGAVTEKVKVATVDKKSGFATGYTDEEVFFDNAYNMSFYPTVKGRYDITYQAVDDFGNLSTEMTYIITCEDRTAPTLRDIDEHMIPTRWGKDVYMRDSDEDSDTDETEASTVITFPYPEYVDNSGLNDPAKKTGVSRVSFEIRDTVNNNAVLKIYDIYNTSGGSDNTYRYNPNILSNGYYVTEKDTDTTYKAITFTEKGLEFDFKNYYEANKDKLEGFDGLGKYTVQYQARDYDQNITTKTYDITLDQEYKDLMPPSIAVDFDKYIYLSKGVKTYTVPTATVTDALSSRLNIDYTISTVKLDEDDKPVIADALSVKSGETLRVEREGAGAEFKVFLRNADYKYAKIDFDNAAEAGKADAQKKLDELSLEITAATELYFTVKATDSVGNSRSYGYESDVSDDGVVRLLIAEKMPASALGIETSPFYYECITGMTPEITMPGEEEDDDDIVIPASPIVKKVEFDGITATLERGDDVLNRDNYNKFSLGSFAITGVPDAYRNFVGFEIKLAQVKEKTGELVIEDIDSLETFYVSGAGFRDEPYSSPLITEEGTGMIVVDNIRVGLAKGNYVFTIRAFDILGNSTAVNYTLKVEDEAEEVVILPSSAPPIPTSGQVNETYTLKSEFGVQPLISSTDFSRAYTVRKISGPGSFTLMGSEFTAFAQGSFFFEEGYYTRDGVYKQMQDVYDLMVDDTMDTTFEVQGIMPVYSAKSVEVILPSVVAHNRYANAKVEITIDAPSGSRVSPSLIKKLDKIDDANQKYKENFNGYAFTPSEDGKYKVTYSASVNTSRVAQQSFVITVGDNRAPTFKVNAPQKGGTKAYALNDPFVFDIMEIIGTEDIKATATTEAAKYEDILFTKRLILPSGEVYSVSDWGNTGRIKTMDSKYEDDKDKSKSGYKLTASGDYKVEYTARDRAGNESKVIYEFSIIGASPPAPWPWRVLSTAMIIIAVLLIAAVVLYLARFQKKKIKA
ncbi:MAG: hypothetical protein FWD58_02380 [Firmicutes bacterium]|nr:hypothetical protein [Bacillota bacterium]